MAEITINGLPIDTEDIDLLVLYCPLATLDAAIKADTEILETMPETDPLRPYFQHRLETHQIALDIAQDTLDNGVATIRTLPNFKPAYTISKEIQRQARKPIAYKGIAE